MKARITRNGGWYVGEVYGTWENWLLGTKWTGWRKVAECMTEWGVRRELQKWKEKNCPDTFEL